MLLFLAQGMARRYSQRKDEQIAIDNKIKLEKFKLGNNTVKYI